MTDFDEIIGFAISREKEAIEFYRELQNIAGFKAQKEVLISFEAMEQGHVKMLEGIQARKAFRERSYPPVNLRLSDFLVEVKPAADMNYQDILISAIKKEERSVAMYTRLASEVEESEAAAVFEALIIQEANHKNHFEKIYDDEILKEN